MNSSYLDQTILDDIFPPGDPENRESFSDFMKIFDDSCGRNLMKLTEAAAGADYEQIMNIAHIFKGMAGGVGAKHLVEMCKKLEKAGKSSELQVIQQLNLSVAEEIKKVRAALDDYARGF